MGRRRPGSPRFLVDHCVPASVAKMLRSGRQRCEVWSAHDAHLEDAADADLIAYADSRGATLITTNRDCAQIARGLGLASVIWLSVNEVDAVEAMARAGRWLEENSLPKGRVLKVLKKAEPKVLSPIR